MIARDAPILPRIRALSGNSYACPKAYVHAIEWLHVLIDAIGQCGQSAFARVTQDWVHENQTLPVELATKLRRRDGELPQVQGLSIDADFNSVDLSQCVFFISCRSFC